MQNVSLWQLIIAIQFHNYLYEAVCITSESSLFT